MQGRRSLVSSPSDPRTERAKRRRNSSSEVAPPPPPSTIEQLNDHPTSIPCDKCGLNVLHAVDLVVCKPCNHTLCGSCAFKTQVKRGCKPFTCPVANCFRCHSTAFDYVSHENGRENIPNPAIGYDNYTMKHLPLDYVKKCHKAQLRESGSQAIAITVTKVAIVDGNYKIDAKTSTFVIKREEGKPVEIINPNAALEEVGSIFAMMYDPLVSPSLNYWNTPVSTLSPKEYLEMHCHPQMRRLIDRALFGLSTGNPSIDYMEYLTGDKQSHQKQFLAAIISADVLMSNSKDSPGPFQLMFGELLSRQKTTKDFQNLMSAFNFAPSRCFKMKIRGEEVLNRLKKGINVQCRDLVLLFFDNVGFKIIGREASYDQWIAMEIVVVTEAVLKELGFYKDDTDGRISREPNHVWKDVLADLADTDGAKERLAQSIVGVQPEDYERLSSCILENIRFVLDHLPQLTTLPTGEIILPRFDRIVSEQSCRIVDEQMGTSDNETDSDDEDTTIEDNFNLHRHSALIPRQDIPTNVVNELGGNSLHRRVNDSSNNDNNEDDNNENEDGNNKNDDDGIVPRVPRNQYTKNNSKVEALHQDLSKTITQEAILDYLKDFNNNQRNMWERTDHDDTEERPVSFDFSGFGCDGQPATAMKRILDADAKKGESMKYDDSYFVSFGGFHTVMKSLNASGEYFEELLKDMFSAWRDSWDKVRWILTPSDPRQRENEYSWYLLASYAVAAKNLADHKGRPVSSVEVNDFMLQRAKEYPICALALLELRIGSILKLMRNAEKLGPRGCIHTFFTTIRLIMPLFAVTHKKDYMYLCQDLLKWYHCASDAQRLIYEKCVFTQLTALGKPIFHDNAVENIVRDFRNALGKIYRKGMDLEMELVAATISERDSVNEYTSDLHYNESRARAVPSSGRKCDKLAAENTCYYQAYDHIKSMQLWEAGVNPTVRGTRKDLIVECGDTALTVPGGGDLHADILSGITLIGRRRTLDYFITYSINNVNDADADATRSDAIVDLQMINVTVAGTAKDRNEQVTLKTSLKANELLPRAYPVTMIMDCIKAMHESEALKDEEERVKITDDIPKSSSTKKQKAQHLVKWRAKVFQKNPMMKDELIQSIDATFQSTSTRRSRDNLLANELFQLSTNIREKERYKHPVQQ